MRWSHQPTDSDTQATAVRLARKCRHIIQACLREEEWIDADREFYAVIREELEAYLERQRSGRPAGDQPEIASTPEPSRQAIGAVAATAQQTASGG